MDNIILISATIEAGFIKSGKGTPFYLTAKIFIYLASIRDNEVEMLVNSHAWWYGK